MANAMYLLQDMCRLCLENKGVHNILEHESLIQDLLLYTGIKHISQSDEFPNTICSICLYRVSIAEDLKCYSTKNDLYLQSLFTGSKGSLNEVAKPHVPLNISTKTKCLVVTERHTEISASSTASERPKSPEAKKAKISVRSLTDMNNSMEPVNVEKKFESPETSKSNITSTTEVTGNSRDCSSDKSEKKQSRSRTTVSTSSTNEENKCEVCHKTYATAKKLYLHARSHSKSIFCPMDACGKSFATKGDLKKHIRAHTGEKPYKCDLCDSSFSQNVTLKTHKDTVHVEKHT